MAKFRSNHVRNRGRKGGGMIIRVMVFFLLILAVLYGALRDPFPDLPVEEPVPADVSNLKNTGLDSIFFLPSGGKGVLIRHTCFAVSYVEAYKLAEWVAYELTNQRVQSTGKTVSERFRPDPGVLTGSAHPEDYSGSGYKMAHLALPEDMAFSPRALSESYYLSNITPQHPGFYENIWKELGEQTRDWARHFGHLYVITGPVVTERIQNRIGENEVVVPDAYYKIVLDLRGVEKKAIAFLLPNTGEEGQFWNFATTVDRVEELTGLDFFHQLIPDALETELEARIDLKSWRVKITRE